MEKYGEHVAVLAQMAFDSYRENIATAISVGSFPAQKNIDGQHGVYGYAKAYSSYCPELDKQEHVQCDTQEDKLEKLNEYIARAHAAITEEKVDIWAEVKRSCGA